MSRPLVGNPRVGVSASCPVTALACAYLCSTVCKAPFTRYNLFSNRFDNRVNVCIHDTTGCHTGCQTGLTTGCIVYTNIQPGCLTRLTTGVTTGCIVYTAGCQSGSTTRFDNRLNEHYNQLNEQWLFVQMGDCLAQAKKWRLQC